MTGVAVLNVDLIAKRLELLHELVPKADTVAVLVNPNSAYTEPDKSDMTHGRSAKKKWSPSPPRGVAGRVLKNAVGPMSAFGGKADSNEATIRVVMAMYRCVAL
jgi:hypothetical protein